MPIVTVERAINQFRELATAAGFDVLHEPSPEHFGSSIIYLNQGNAQLRLIWNGKDEYLSLQLSHGPTEASWSDWLELFGTKCIFGSFRDSESPEVNFLSSVEYGLELMLPGNSG